MFNRIKQYINKFTTPRRETSPSISELVIFDGDQTPPDTFTRLYRPNQAHCKYIWVTVTTIPRVVKHTSVEVIKPSSVGKEATDTQIALSVFNSLTTTPNITKVFIVSSDGDFIDVIINLSRYFPTIKFVLVDDQKHPTSKASGIARRTLSLRFANCSVVRLKRSQPKKLSPPLENVELPNSHQTTTAKGTNARNSRPPQNSVRPN